MKEIKSRYQHSIDLGVEYAAGLDFQILNRTQWLEVTKNILFKK